MNTNDTKTLNLLNTISQYLTYFHNKFNCLKVSMSS